MFVPPVVKPKSEPPQRSGVEAQRPGQAAVAPRRLLQRTIGNQAMLRLLAQRAGANRSAPGPIEAKLKVGVIDDPLEHEADRVADQVMRMPAPEISVTASPPQLSRKCADCEEEEEKLQRKSAGPQAATREAPAIVHEVLRSPGQPLDAETRGFFEPRFGQDFSSVRVHTGAPAEQSAHDVDARAYTVGHSIVFNAGQFAPETREGRRLIAHELTHVTQHGSQLRRMTLGHGKPVCFGDIPELREVPDEERSRVLAAIARVRKIAKDPKGYANCHRTFAETCPGGSASSLEDAFDKVVLWRFGPGQKLDAAAVTPCECPQFVGYTDTGYAGGEAALSFDILHELGHVCGISCVALPHYLADKLALYCMGPQERDEDNQLTLGFGRSTEDWALILSYGWLLREWRAGRLSMRLNADFNVMGALQGLRDLGGEPRTPAGEIGGATLDVRARPFSGEHFGGLSLHAGLGGQFGRFLVRPPSAGDPADIRADAALVVEVGTRIEWSIKKEAVDNEEPGRVKPRALDVSYRVIQPATTGARRAHEFLASYVYHF